MSCFESSPHRPFFDNVIHPLGGERAYQARAYGLEVVIKINVGQISEAEQAGLRAVDSIISSLLL
jgi:hypothetical protein